MGKFVFWPWGGIFWTIWLNFWFQSSYIIVVNTFWYVHFFRFDFGVLSTPLAWWNWYCEISPGVSGNHWHLPKTHSPWLKKILNFYSRMNPGRLSETHWQFSEIISPPLKKILNFDFWTHPEWAKLVEISLEFLHRGWRNRLNFDFRKHQEWAKLIDISLKFLYCG